MKKKCILIAISVLVVVVLIVCGNLFAVQNVEVVFDDKTGKTTEYEILSAANISSGVIIFNLRETEIKQKVSDYFGDNSIVVTNIERIFPNTVKLYVRERAPIYQIDVLSESGEKLCTSTDKDFQRSTILPLENISIMLIRVEELTIVDTYNLKECRQLRELADAFIANGIDEEALPYLFEKVSINSDAFAISLRHCSSKFYISRENITHDVTSVYEKYIKLSDKEKANCELIA